MENSTDGIKVEITGLKKYKKKKIMVHVIESEKVPNVSGKIVLHTLEGDVEINSNENNYIIIGPKNDIYPIQKWLFDSKYTYVETVVDEYIINIAKEYAWNVESIKTCVLCNDSYVYAKKMNNDFSVFVKHCQQTIYGKTGDYYVVSEADMENAYIISAEIMDSTYDEV